MNTNTLNAQPSSTVPQALYFHKCLLGVCVCVCTAPNATLTTIYAWDAWTCVLVLSCFPVELE